MTRPVAALAFRPELAPDLLGPRQRARLEAACALAQADPITAFDGAALATVEVLFTSWGCPVIDEAALVRLPRLRLVAHAAGSVKPIVSEALWQRGVTVTSAAAANARPVAEFALAAILLANKDAFAVRERYRSGRRAWRYPWTDPGATGNNGAVVGIVGASRTGRQLIALLRPFDLTVLCCDPYLSMEEAQRLDIAKVALDALLARAQVVSLHAPLTPATTGMIGRRELALMRDGATLINTARGPIVDTPALAEALRSGRLKAVLDVSDPEPLPPDSALFDLPNVFLTPHIAGAAGLETQRLADCAIDEIERFAAGKALLHAVTADALALLA